MKTSRLLIFPLLLGACGSNPAPVAEQGERQEISAPIIVQSGQSLPPPSRNNVDLRSSNQNSSASVRESVDSQLRATSRNTEITEPALPRTSGTEQSQARVSPANTASAATSQSVRSISRSPLQRSNLPSTPGPEETPAPSSNQNLPGNTVGNLPQPASSSTSGAQAPLQAPNRTAEYIVKRGDTLYSIAFQNDLDHRVLAQANALSAPFTIFVGQRLNMDTSKVVDSSPPPSTNTPATAAIRTSQGASTRTPLPREPQWRWPLNGNVVNAFDGENNKGLDIGASLGASVSAAAAGDVVYSGRSVQGAGELIIIRHNDRYLSAYANNRSRNVEVGERVAAGEKIAEVGVSSEGDTQLHFEIRREGEAVNPRSYLP